LERARAERLQWTRRSRPDPGDGSRRRLPPKKRDRRDGDVPSISIVRGDCLESPYLTSSALMVGRRQSDKRENFLAL
jgi:hypothetical protein